MFDDPSTAVANALGGADGCCLEAFHELMCRLVCDPNNMDWVDASSFDIPAFGSAPLPFYYEVWRVMCLCGLFAYVACFVGCLICGDV